MCSYLLVQQIILPIAGMQVEVSVLSRDLVPHGMLKGMVVNKRHCKKSSEEEQRKQQVVGSDNSNTPLAL